MELPGSSPPCRQRTERAPASSRLQTARSHLGQEVVVKRDPVEDRLPDPALVRPGRWERRLFGGSSRSSRPGGQTSAASTAACRAIRQVRPSRRRPGSLASSPGLAPRRCAPLRAVNLDAVELGDQVEHWLVRAFDTEPAPLAAVDQTRARRPRARPGPREREAPRSPRR